MADQKCRARLSPGDLDSNLDSEISWLCVSLGQGPFLLSICLLLSQHKSATE